jgi:AcrR family transcriptional regulator
MFASLTDFKERTVPSVADRRKRNRQEMVDGILSAARAQMREEGVAALNLNEVARRVGVTAPAIYKYFPSKMAVYDALFRLGTRLYVEELKALNLDDAKSGGAAIRGALEHQLGFAARNPDLYQLVLQRPVPGFVPSAEGLVEAAEVEQFAIMFVSRLIERGLIAPPGPPERAFALVASVAAGLTSNRLANEPDVPIGEGLFSSLVPDAVRLFEMAWAPANTKQSRTGVSRGRTNKNRRKSSGGGAHA